MCRAIRVGFGGARRGEKASLGHEEAVSRQTQGDMVIEAAPAAALELGQADLLLEFTIVLLDPVAALDVPDEVLERRVGRQRTQPEAPVLGSLGVLNDQPFLGIEVVTALRSERPEPGAPRTARSTVRPILRATRRGWCGSHALARTSTRTAPAWTLTDLVRPVAGSAVAAGTTVVLLSIPSA